MTSNKKQQNAFEQHQIQRQLHMNDMIDTSQIVKHIVASKNDQKNKKRKKKKDANEKIEKTKSIHVFFNVKIVLQKANDEWTF